MEDFISNLSSTESDFFSAIFIDGEDMHSIYKNYQLALETYFFYYLQVSDLADDIEDGLVVPSLSGVNNIECMLLSYQCCCYFKLILGSDELIIDPEGSYEIKGNRFSSRGSIGEKNTLEQGAQGLIRSFTSNSNFKDYELGVLALSIIERSA